MRYVPLSKRWTIYGSILGALVLVATGVSLGRSAGDEEQVHFVAHIERGDGEFAEIHRIALSHYLDELSAEIPEHRFVLKTFSIDNDQETLRNVYERDIAPDPRYILVLDNTWAEHVQAIDWLVAERNIPMLSLNADKGDADFGGHAAFIGHSDNVPSDLLHYMTEVIQPETVAFVGEDNYWLTRRFEDELGCSRRSASEEPACTLADHVFLVRDSVPEDDEQNRIKANLRAWSDESPEPAVLLLNVHNDWGHKLINFVDEHLDHVTILAGSYAASEGRASRFSGDSNELILLTEPEDAVPKQVARDIERFRRRYPETFLPRYNAPFFVKRCLDAVEIMRQIVLGGRQALDPTGDEVPATGSRNEALEVDRELFATFFREELGETTLTGRHDLYSFDDENRRIDEISFVEYEEGVATSRKLQLGSDRKVIPTVFFGIDILDIGQLDPVRGRFNADFYYWVRLDPTHSRMKDYVHFRNLARREATLIEETDSFLLERVSGEFNVNFDLRNYPMDRQELTLELALVDPSDDVRVAFDRVGFERGKRRAEGFDIPGWQVEDYYVTVDNMVSKAFGGRTVEGGHDARPQKYKTLTVRVRAKRRMQGGVISVVLPLFIIGIAALALLFVRSTRFSSVGDVYTGIFLSIVTYSIAFAQLTPNASVVTKADLLFYLTFVVVLLVFLRFVLLNALGWADSSHEVGARGQRVAGVVAVALYFSAALFIVLG